MDPHSWQIGTAVISVLPAIMQNGPSEVIMPVVTLNNLHVCVHPKKTLLQVFIYPQKFQTFCGFGGGGITLKTWIKRQWGQSRTADTNL
jgi:hypothetical protein